MNRNILIGCCLLLIGIFTVLQSLTYFCVKNLISYSNEIFEKDIDDLDAVRLSELKNDYSIDEFVRLSEKYKNSYEEFKTKHQGFLAAPFFISVFSGIVGIFCLYCAVAIFRRKVFNKQKLLFIFIGEVLIFLIGVVWSFSFINSVIESAQIKHAIMVALGVTSQDFFSLKLLSLKQDVIAPLGFYVGIFCIIPLLCWYYYRDNSTIQSKDTL